MNPERRRLALATKGFMPPEEGDALWAAATAAVADVPGAPLLEVGSYCGRSTIWLGDVAETAGSVLFAVDHHRGSEENQAGWEHHDPEVVDGRTGSMDTLPFFRSAIHDAGLTPLLLVRLDLAVEELLERSAELVVLGAEQRALHAPAITRVQIG